jgi:hypothetical protein
MKQSVVSMIVISLVASTLFEFVVKPSLQTQTQTGEI